MMKPEIRDWLQNNCFSAAQPVLKNSADIYPLIPASQQSRSDMVDFLIEQKAKLDVMDQYCNNALWAACYADNNDCINALIHAGININYQYSASGATALIYAASSGRERVVEQLLAAGADPTLKTHDDFTALDLASTRKILNLLSKLVKSGDRNGSTTPRIGFTHRFSITYIAWYNCSQTAGNIA